MHAQGVIVCVGVNIWKWCNCWEEFCIECLQWTNFSYQILYQLQLSNFVLTYK